MTMRKSCMVAVWAVLTLLLLAAPAAANHNDSSDASSPHSERQLVNVFGNGGGGTDNHWGPRRYRPMQYMKYKKKMGYYMMMMKKKPGYYMMGYMMMMKRPPVWKPPRPPTPPSLSGVRYKIPFELAISLRNTRRLRHLQQQQPSDVFDTQRIVTTFLTQQLWTPLSLRSLNLDTRTFENRGAAGFRVRFRLIVRL